MLIVGAAMVNAGRESASDLLLPRELHLPLQQYIHSPTISKSANKKREDTIR